MHGARIDRASKIRTGLTWKRVLGAVAILCFGRNFLSCFTPPSDLQSKLPSVSVQIATYNRPSLVLEALQQIEVQDYAGKIEVLILDDSPQSCQQAVEHFASTSRHCITYRFLSERHTIGAKRNLAVNLSQTDLICTWDDDDIYPKDRIRLQVDFLLRHPRCRCAMIERRYFFWKTGHLRACHDELQLFPLENTLCFWRYWFQAGRTFDAGNINEGLGLLRGKRGLKHPGRVGILSIQAEELPFVYVKHSESMTGDQMVAAAEGPVGFVASPLLALARALHGKRFPALADCTWYTAVLTSVRKLLCEIIEKDIKQLEGSEELARYLRKLTGRELEKSEGLPAKIWFFMESLRDSKTDAGE